MQFVAPPPGQIGSLAILADAIPAGLPAVAHHLGITPRTLAGYLASDNAPRAVKVALFVESDYGRNLIHTEAHNSAAMHAGLVDALRRENATLLARIARLEALGYFGAANSPLHSAATAAARPLAVAQVVAQRRHP